MKFVNYIVFVTLLIVAPLALSAACGGANTSNTNVTGVQVNNSNSGTIVQNNTASGNPTFGGSQGSANVNPTVSVDAKLPGAP